MTSLLLAFLATWLLSSALDLLLARWGGYGLRAETPVLIAIHLGALGLWSVVGMLTARTIALIPRTPSPLTRFPFATLLVLTATPAAVGASMWERPPGPFPTFLLLLVVVVGMALAVAELRRPLHPIRPQVLMIATAVGAIGLGLASRPYVPGRTQLAHVTRPAASETDHPNVVMIVLDTVRADHMSLYGYPRATTPAIDRHFAEASIYTQAVAPSSWTLPSHASIFTGLYPAAHGADTSPDDRGIVLHDFGRGPNAQGGVVRPLSQEATTLAEILQAHGYETAAICANTSYLYRVFGLDQGFDAYVDHVPAKRDRRPLGFRIANRLILKQSWWFRRTLGASEVPYIRANEVTDLALEWLGDGDPQPFLLFLNYMDAHQPIFPIGDYAELYPDANKEAEVNWSAICGREREILPEERGALVDGYDAELRFLDDQLGRLLDVMQTRGLADNTLFVLVGDHGEAFGEHHLRFHNNGAYQTVVHVPLAVRYPNVQQRRVEDRVVSIVSVFPTVLDQLDLPVPTEVAAKPLDDTAHHRVVTYTAPWPAQATGRTEAHHWGIVRDPYKLIERSDGTVELYDIQRDAAELLDLAPSQPDLVQALQAELENYRQDVQGLFPVETISSDPETLERLRALGYLN